MINILFLHAGAELYGADVVLLELVKNLDKKQFRPYVVLPCEGPLVDELKKNNIDVSIVEYPILRRKYFNPIGIFNYIKDMVKTIGVLESFCKEKNIELVHSNTVAVMQGAMLWKRLNVKHIWHIHEMIDKPRFVYKFMAKVVCKNCDKVLTVSNSVKSHWLKSGYFTDESIVVIHNGIDTKRFNEYNDCSYVRKEFNIADDEIIVGFVGRINAIKGQEVFVEAMRKVIKDNPKAKALIVGGVYQGQEWRIEKLKRQIKESGFERNFILSDFRKDNEMIHSALDIFVLSSIAYDSFPTVVLEAMASKTPVVAFRSGGVVEMIEDNKNGLFADFGSSDDLARKISTLLRNKRLREQMGEVGCNILHNNFTSEIFSKKIQCFYNELMQRS